MGKVMRVLLFLNLGMFLVNIVIRNYVGVLANLVGVAACMATLKGVE
jgi:hypothetical protein